MFEDELPQKTVVICWLFVSRHCSLYVYYLFNYLLCNTTNIVLMEASGMFQNTLQIYIIIYKDLLIQ